MQGCHARSFKATLEELELLSFNTCMARIKLSVPNREPDYRTQIELTVNFINYGNHMGNDAVATLCHEGRLRFLKSIGHTELDCFGKSLIQADAAYMYRGEAFYGDLLEVEMYVEDINEYGYDLLYKFSCGSKTIAFAKNGIVFFDYETRKLSKAPQEFLDHFKK
ncbi:thioesterase family protein [Halobacteriovorax sp. DPLXC-1]|uniref:thioesterase family protein n=2 Tax=unclassified Halobacteriovorax TaxID=2639665 RepID=UPI002FEEFE38